MPKYEVVDENEHGNSRRSSAQEFAVGFASAHGILTTPTDERHPCDTLHTRLCSTKPLCSFDESSSSVAYTAMKPNKRGQSGGPPTLSNPMISAVRPLGRIRSLRRLLSPKQFQAVLSKKSSPSPSAPVFENPEAPCISFISRLPNELLVHILEFAKQAMEDRIPELHLQGPPAGIPSHSWLNITLVCRHWRTIILTTPSFWCNIEFCSYQATKLRIERSGAANIEISYSDSYLEPRIPDRDEILRLLFANIERACSLWLFGTCAREFLQEVAPYRNAPALEVLRLQFCELYGLADWHNKSDTFCEAFISDTSKLRRVDLGGINVLPTSRIFSSNITSLFLNSYDLPHVKKFTFPTMISLLQKMPRLEALTLKIMLQGNDSVSESVRLPLLKYLHLSTLSYIQICSFMQHLELPPSTTIVCRCWCNSPEDLMSSLPALPQRRPFSGFRVSYSGTKMDLHGYFDSSRPNDSEEHAAPGAFSLQIRALFLPSVRVPALIHNLLRPINDSLTCVNKLAVIFSDAPIAFDWTPLFRPFDAVDEISICGSSTEWHLFALALAKTVPVPSSEEDLRFMCPRLRALSFAECVCEWHTSTKSKSKLHPKFFDVLANALEMRRAHSGRMDEVTIGKEIVQVGEIRALKLKAGRWGTKWNLARR
ncbi:hypothetical protein EVG20_g2268 [Dentipellis fragilis]|uniref:F-box domain-containing protein n=1 Tax=Dentipellis fragilis TaxID=205917 RepID=A0A4Y9ZA79_9AGAM|nr:hypothetical protein EVG20_g2268 [Dentipellis fragilis]